MAHPLVKQITSACVALGLVCGGTIIGVVPAFADQPITTQPYTTILGIDQLHAQGLDGTGVKIALMDAPVDTTVPELQGVTVIKKAFCNIDYAPSSVAHATEIASILASPYYGWAPKATILNYAVPGTAEVPDGETQDSAWPDCADQGETQSMGYQVERALNDGADVISISLGGKDIDASMPFALVRAALKGVPVVMAVGNDSQGMIDGTASPNTVVAVGAVDTSGQRASYSNWGDGLSIMAYGGPVVARQPNNSGALSVINTGTQGTSFSTPMVAGALALAKQKWPNANGNQLERVMFDVIDGVADHASAQPTTGMGFGVLNAPLLVATDPSSYSTDNVLAQKAFGTRPKADDFTAYENGTADPTWTSGDNDYVYRGCDPMILKYGIPSGTKVEASTAPECQPSPSGPQTSDSPTPVDQPGASIPWGLIGVGAGVAIIVVLAVAVTLLTRRRKPGPPPPMPPGWPPPTYAPPPIPPGWTPTTTPGTWPVTPNPPPAPPYPAQPPYPAPRLVPPDVVAPNPTPPVTGPNNTGMY